MAKKKENSPIASSTPNLIVNLIENTERTSSYDQPSFRKPYNPDDLYRKTMDYRIYDSMRIDDQASICLQMKKDLVIGPGFSFHTKDANQKDIVKNLTSIFEEDVLTPFDEQLEEILSAYEYGHSCSEKIFKKKDDGSLSFLEFKTRQPNTWLYETDDKGNVTDYKQRGMATGQDIIIKKNAVLHYVNKKRFQNPYGESDLRPAYQAWFTKNEITKYFAIFLEKSASPIPVGKYGSSVSKEIKESLLSILKKFQTKTAMVVPKDMDIQFLESSNNGEVYRSAINIFNMFIGRCLFVPDLLGFQGAETSGGSYSLGKEQMRIFFMHLSRRRKYLEALINKHLVYPICVYNHGVFDTYPKFKFNPISEDSVYESVKMWTDIVRSNAFKPTDEEINYVRNLLNFPEGEVLRDEPAATPTAYFNNNHDAHRTICDKPEQAELLKTYKIDYGNDYHKKVDFKKIENSLDNYLSALKDEVAPVVKYIFNDLNDQIEKKKIVQNQRLDRVEDLQIKKLKDIKIILKNSFREHYQEAKKIAQSELFKVNYTLPLPTDEFLKFLEDETYSFVGDWSYNITKSAKIKIIAAIKDGKPLSTVIDLLNEEGLADSMVALERYSRTKFTEVMNRGRLEYFESSGIVQGYQYSAILDESTSDICQSLDGKIFKNGEQPISPLHFNCRSLLIPITIYEDVKKWDNVSESLKEKINKGGFSWQ